MSVSGAAAIAAPASGTMSLFAISSALLASTRATSSATLPLPITATRLAPSERSGPVRKSGWPFSQADEAPRAPDDGPGPRPARRASCRSPCRWRRSRRRRPRRSSSQERSRPISILPAKRTSGWASSRSNWRDDRLGALVIGRHAGPHQAIGRRQAVDDVDMQVRVGRATARRRHRSPTGPRPRWQRDGSWRARLAYDGGHD